MRERGGRGAEERGGRGAEESEAREKKLNKLTSPFLIALLATRPPSLPGSAAGVSIPRSSMSQRISDAEVFEVRVAWRAEVAKRQRRRWLIGDASNTRAAAAGGAALAGLAQTSARGPCSGATAATLGR